MGSSDNPIEPVVAEFEHTQLDRGRSSIRLVEILPDLSDRSLIQCRISQHILPLAAGNEEHSTAAGKQPLIEDDNVLPRYSCLSYVWGDSKDPFVILMDGKIFWVRQNLRDFLAIARETISNTYLWIDALCIDQRNTSERNHQVRQMGRIYSNAETVLAWLGADSEVASVLQKVNEAVFERRPSTYTAELRQTVPFWMARPIIDLKRRSFGALPSAPTSYTIGWRDSYFQDLLNDITGKADKLFEPFTTNAYWSRAWVTQEVLLAKRTVVIAGTEAHGLIALAETYRSAVHFHGDSAFENIIDVIFRKQNQDTEHNMSGQGIDNWGLINLLHRFRYKECAVRRDRVYSLLALSKEGKGLSVDYDVPEANIFREVLNIRKSSMCLCSAAIVAHALSPWSFDDGKGGGNIPFAKIHMYAASLDRTVCQGCWNWVPTSWKDIKGRLFCLGRTCADTQGHIFWEHSKQQQDESQITGDISTEGEKSSDSIHIQTIRNNKSQLLCKEGAGLTITHTPWPHVYLLQFTLRTMIEFSLHNIESGDTGLNACGNLWPSEANPGIAEEGRLTLCDEH